MAEGNTFHQPRLIIDNKEIFDDISGNLTFRGSNNLNSLNVTISNPYIQTSSLLLKKVKLYLNHGNDDNIPIFTGYINSVNVNKNNISLTCQDPRLFLTGKNGEKIVLDDENNYDGYSLGSFLYSYIEKNINTSTNKVIGTDMLNDTYPIVTCTGLRERGTIYDMAKDIIVKAIDTDTDFQNPLAYQFDIIEDYDVAQLVIKKDKPFTDKPSVTFSFNDGLKNYTYNKRLPPNTANYEGGTFAYTSRPIGRSNIELSFQEDGNPISRAEQRNIAMKQILLENQQENELKITVNKAFHIALGSIIRLNVDDSDIYGNHRVTGKSISFGKSCTCNITLNKKPIKVSDYITN